MKQIQISAIVSEETRKALDRYARAQGLKKGFVIEEALLHHLQAMKALPPDVIIPPRLVVSRQSGEEILERLEQPTEPTEAMHSLFDD